MPLGNVHPSALGYSVIAAAATVAEPSSWLLMGLGLTVVVGYVGSRSIGRLNGIGGGDPVESGVEERQAAEKRRG